jgi:hypothetical protein
MMIAYPVRQVVAVQEGQASAVNKEVGVEGVDRETSILHSFFLLSL